jgi:ATP-dependent 26S proteasome regulatory subunit
MGEDTCRNPERLMAGLRRIETKLHEQVRRVRQADGELPDERFRGLYISEREVDDIIERPFPAVESDTPASVAAASKETSGPVTSPELSDRLQRLRHMFDLSDFETDTLLVGILPELDLRYQKLFGYLQDDVTRKSPTVSLVIDLLCVSNEERLNVRRVFAPETPVSRYELLRLYDETNYRPSPLPARFLQVDERIIDYLLGIDRIDRRLRAIVRLVKPDNETDEPVLPDETRQRLEQLVDHFRQEAPIIQFLGKAGTGRRSAAAMACRQLGLPLMVVDTDRLGEAGQSPESLLNLIFREGRLQHAALYFNRLDALMSDESNAVVARQAFEEELAVYPHWVFITGERPRQFDTGDNHKPCFYLELPAPNYRLRRKLWARYGNHQAPLANDVDLADIAGRFRLSGAQIARAAAMARSLALGRDPADGTVTSRDIYAACRQQSGHRLSGLATKLNTVYSWEDIILPPDRIGELHEICDQVHHRHTVYSDWGFERKLSRGKGLNVLFAGPSGTGKTMAAEIMSNELGLDIYRIDLAGIVSKYIGETEKNLDKIFQEGKTANAILFFDEADALFGKRSEVRDAHDRYANIEVAYLLQKMEEYDGMVILATNLRKNMDEAFARRMHFAIEFPQPEENDRRRIWQRAFPAETPLAEETDLEFMARQFRITGGNIKNIALGAAFLTAAEGGSVDMPRLIRATRREYQKMGRLCTESEFDRYFELVRS